MMADAPCAPIAASLLSVLSQLPADVVETNILEIIGCDGMCSREASVVRRSRSKLTLGAVAGGELTLQKVQAAQLGLYTSANATPSRSLRGAVQTWSSSRWA